MGATNLGFERGGELITGEPLRTARVGGGVDGRLITGQLSGNIIVSLADGFGGDNGFGRAVALWSFFAPEQSKTIRLVIALFLLLAPLSRIQMPGS